MITKVTEKRQAQGYPFLESNTIITASGIFINGHAKALHFLKLDARTTQTPPSAGIMA